MEGQQSFVLRCAKVTKVTFRSAATSKIADQPSAERPLILRGYKHINANNRRCCTY